jgi:hypothetical protein
MQVNRWMIAGLCGIAILAAGCRRTNSVNQSAFRSAINDYFSTRQECIWNDPIKLPAQATTSDEEQTEGYDALVDAGLLARTSAEKKRFLIGSKQVNDYDLSPQGRSAWTTDPTQPGFGNFCFGHREVTTVDSFTPSDDANPVHYAVSFHYDVAGVPGWASSAEMKTAFPKIAADTSGQQTATAVVVKSDKGWLVSGIQ